VGDDRSQHRYASRLEELDCASHLVAAHVALPRDEDHAVAEAYEVWGEKKNYGKTYMGIIRSAFLIDEKGTISEAWYKVSPKDTPKNLLKALS